MGCSGCGGSYAGGAFPRQGAQGIPGPPGPEGPEGPVGPEGPSVTSTSGFAANTSNANINTDILGTDLSLPDSQSLPLTITVDGTNTFFTVQEDGRYRLSYHINPEAASIINSRIVVNGVELPQTVISPTVASTKFSAEAIVSLLAGDVISLQLFGVATLIILDSGVGASLTNMRVE